MSHPDSFGGAIPSTRVHTSAMTSALRVFLSIVFLVGGIVPFSVSAFECWNFAESPSEFTCGPEDWTYMQRDGLGRLERNVIDSDPPTWFDGCDPMETYDECANRPAALFRGVDDETLVFRAADVVYTDDVWTVQGDPSYVTYVSGPASYVNVAYASQYFGVYDQGDLLLDLRVNRDGGSLFDVSHQLEVLNLLIVLLLSFGVIYLISNHA